MILYLLCENVDLGYHVDAVYLSSEEAHRECETKNKVYVDLKTTQLLAMDHYTPADVDQWIRSSGVPFFVEEHVVIE